MFAYLFRALSALALLLSIGVAPAWAADAAASYPNGQITFVVAATPGGATDITARLVAEQLTKDWGVPVVVDNRAGAGGVVAASYVVAAHPDGQTVLIAPSAFAVRSALDSHLRYDAQRDFAGVGLMSSTPSFLVVPPSIGVKTVPELIAYAKAKHGAVIYGSAGIGSTGHLHAAVLVAAGGFKAQHAPYRGTPEAINDVMLGRVDFAFAPGPNVIPFVKQGKLVILAATSQFGAQFEPGTPALTQVGVTSDFGDDWYGALVPSQTPKAIRDKLSRQIAHILTEPDVIARLAVVGALPRSSTPEQFDAVLRQDMAKIHKIGVDNNIKLQ